MKAIATNIYDFSNWLKYGEMPIAINSIIDLSDLNQDINYLIERIGCFEESFEVFFCVISPLIKLPKDDYYMISITDIVEIKPLTEKVKKVLQQKLGVNNVGDAIEYQLYEKIVRKNLERLSENGLNLVQDIFFIDCQFSDKFKSMLLDTKYSLIYGDYRKKENKIDYLLKYARTKPFPIQDLGYFYDVGTIFREIAIMSDEDIKNKEAIKEKCPDKYGDILSVIELTKFISMSKNSGSEKKAFEDYSKFSIDNVYLENLNRHLQIEGLSYDINYILLYAYYFKIAKIIREQENLSDESFIKPVKLLDISKKEVYIALFICGYMFGSLKFQRLFYEIHPLNIFKTSDNTNEIDTPKVDVIKEENKTVSEANLNIIIEYVRSFPNGVYIKKIASYLKEKGIKSYTNSKRGKIYSVDEIRSMLLVNERFKISYNPKDRRKKNPIYEYI